MEEPYYINTARGYYDIAEKLSSGYKDIDGIRLINPSPMVFNHEELKWIKEHLSDFLKQNYSDIPDDILNQLHKITLNEIKTRSYIFTWFFNTFDEDVYLMTLKVQNKLYNIYMIKYTEMEGIYDGTELIDHKLANKVRLESENWYKNLFSDEQEYLKSKY
ncbi:hypothetical protein CQ046_20145 [Chryseobacterium sp. MYb7]|uniref:hypothetical protein n=1 Tax=Chryseobacterium sp. MYb7 TaxID=1827290 RepID=UPI000D00F795|nr:hypothetical protein [Chryseobacterium sp. MYb7]PRA97790.1 hypothetical protein CQ046_20145 [Chryseobacterium sp. MYb7]